MLIKKMIRTMKLYRAQFISMIIMIALGIGMFVGFNMEWYSLEEDVGAFFEKTGFADYRIVTENPEGFSKKDLKKIENISGVEDSTRFFSVNMLVKGNSDTIALNVAENENVSGFVVTSGDVYDNNSKDGFWISDKYADENKLHKNDEITLKYKGVKITGIIKGFIKSGEYLICLPDKTQLMPNFKKYGYVYISPKMYKDALGREVYTQINVKTNLSKKKFVKEVNKALGRTELVIPKEDNVSYEESEGEMTEGKTMGLILPVLFLAIAVLTMVTTMHRLTASEKRQIGTFKALGFKNKKIIRHYVFYAFSIGILGTLIGIVLGTGLCAYIINPNGMMGTYIDMDDWGLHTPLFVWATLVGVNLFLVLIGLYSVKRMLKGTAADALKIYTPKKVRSLFIERFAIWNKFKFGTKWNMRDVLRHKARSSMTLFGILGCMILLIGSLGMQDTLDDFIKIFYKDAIGYNTKINLDTEHTTEKDVKDLCEKYNGDWSATSSVQAEDKTVGIEVYHLKHGMIKFVSDDVKNFELKNNGVYICERIAKDLSLKKGDTFEFSPFGSKKKYKVKVADVIRQMSESIIMTDVYAKKIEYKYQANVIYTKAKHIKSSSKILNTQTKKSVMEAFDTFIEIMRVMVFVLAIVAIVLGIVVLYNLGIMSYTERYREMATLKVVGFKDKEIGKLLINQNTWLTVIGVVLGIPLGILTLQILVDSLASEYEMFLSIRLSSYLISVLLTFGMSLLVGLMVSRKNKHINMVEALKVEE